MTSQFRHTRLNAFIIGALATGLAGLAGAQSAIPPENDAAFRANVQYKRPSFAVVWPDDHSTHTEFFNRIGW